jgi:hypothetical protein
VKAPPTFQPLAPDANAQIERIAREFAAELVRFAESSECGGKARCATCAFRQGTEANGHPITVLKAMRILTYGGRFFCHEGLEPGEKPTHLCAGFLAARETEILEGAAYEVAWIYDDQLFRH